MAKQNAPSCCCCCNVKIGTFIVAIYLLIAGIMSVVLASLVLSNTIDPSTYYHYVDSDYNFDANDTVSNDGYMRTNLWLTVGSGVCFVIIGVMAIHGVVKNRAGYMIPLFIVQIFDFLCAIVSVAVVMFYWPLFKKKMLACPRMTEEMRESLKNLKEGWLIAIVFSLLFFCLCLKAFFLSVVYRCYKHTMTQALHSRGRQDLEINVVANEKANEAPIYKLPKYEDIQKVPLVTDIDEVDCSKPPAYEI